MKIIAQGNVKQDKDLRSQQTNNPSQITHSPSQIEIKAFLNLCDAAWSLCVPLCVPNLYDQGEYSEKVSTVQPGLEFVSTETKF